jgi:RNA recognition motif-containing protein
MFLPFRGTRSPCIGAGAYSTDLIANASSIQIRQVRQGISSNTKGTAFVVYEDVADAKQACDKLNGFNFQGRYLVGA